MFRWSFDPESSVKEAPIEREPTPLRKRKGDSWVAPEHARLAASMKRDYPRNEKGEKIPGRGKELKLDKRPSIMIPPRPTKMGWK